MWAQPPADFVNAMLSHYPALSAINPVSPPSACEPAQWFPSLKSCCCFGLQELALGGWIMSHGTALVRLLSTGFAPPVPYGVQAPFSDDEKLLAENCSWLQGVPGWNLSGRFNGSNGCQIQYWPDSQRTDLQPLAGSFLLNLLFFVRVSVAVAVRQSVSTAHSVERKLLVSRDNALPVSLCLNIYI